MRRDGNWKFRKAIKILVMVTVAVLLFGFGTEFLWNWLMPTIFGLHPINFVQAIGLVVLSKILLGGFGGRHGGRGWGRDRWKEGMRARWEQMSPEDRERFRTGMRGRRNWCSDWSDRKTQQPTEQAAEQKGI